MRLLPFCYTVWLLAVPYVLCAADQEVNLDPARGGAPVEGIGAVPAAVAKLRSARIRPWSSEHGEWDWITMRPFLYKRAASINNTFLERGLTKICFPSQYRVADTRMIVLDIEFRRSRPLAWCVFKLEAWGVSGTALTRQTCRQRSPHTPCANGRHTRVPTTLVAAVPS